MTERWKAVVGFEAQYEVSNLKRVRDNRTGRILAERNGYVQLRVAVGKRTDRSVRKLYAEAFEGAAPHRKVQLVSEAEPVEPTISQAAIPGECWRPVVGWEGEYSVSDHGRVRKDRASLKSPKGHVLTPGNADGYRNVVLYLEGKRTTRTIHTLVAAAFLGPCPAGHEVNHVDGVRSHNLLSNLEYVTHARNKQHGFEIGISTRPAGELNGMARLTEADVREIRKLWAQRPGRRLPPDHPLSRESIATRFDVAGALISMIVHRKIWTHLDD